MTQGPNNKNNVVDIEIQVGGEAISGWEGLQVVRTINAASDAFAFSVPWNPTNDNAKRFKPFQVNTVGIYAKLPKSELTRVSTGYIESISASMGADSKSLELQGRSTTGVLVDWSAGGPEIGFEIDGVTFNDVAKKLAWPNSVYMPENTKVIDVVSIEPGQTVFEVLSKLAGAHGKWPRPLPNGALEFTNFNADRAPVVDITEGESPLLSVTTNHDVTKRFQKYMVFQSAEGTYSTATVSDFEALGRNVRRHKIVEPSQPSTALQKAAEKLRANALLDSYSVTATVVGWTRKGGLWEAGDIIRLHAPGGFVMKPSKFIVERATLQLDENGGQITQLDLALPEVFDADPSKMNRYQNIAMLPWTPAA